MQWGRQQLDSVSTCVAVIKEKTFIHALDHMQMQIDGALPTGNVRVYSVSVNEVGGGTMLRPELTRPLPWILREEFHTTLCGV